MAAPKHLDLANRIAVVRDYSTLWQHFFAFFADDLSDRVFTQEEEQEFANIVSLLALNHYKFQELTRGYSKETDKIVSILKETPTLEQIQLMQEATFSKIQVEWHTLFIGMNKILGKMLGELPPKKLAEIQAQQMQDEDEDEE